MRDKVDQREQAEAPEPVAVELPTPLSDDLALASAVGNRAMAMAVAAHRGGGARRVARQPTPPPAPATPDAPPDPEKEVMTEADKERARKTLIAPLRAAGDQLSAGPKANMGSISRHLKPAFTAVVGVKWKPADVFSQALNAVEELPAVIDLLESLKLSDRQAVLKARQHWAAAKRDLVKAGQAILKQNIPDPKHPDHQPRDGAPEDIAAVAALEGQVDATIKDLAEAPRNQEGYRAVEETAARIVEQFSTVQPIDDFSNVALAKAEFMEGIGVLAPLALGKEDAVKEAQRTLFEMANKLAGLVGDEPAEGPKEDSDVDPSAAPLPPAPPGPNSLPPPPPPPPAGGGTPAPAKAPAPAAAP